MQEPLSKFAVEPGPPPKLKPVLPTNLKAAEVAHHSWRVITMPTTTIEDLMRPEAWVHCARQMQKGALIDALAHDGSWYWRAIVRHVEGNAVHLGLIDQIYFEPLPEPETKFRPQGIAA